MAAPPLRDAIKGRLAAITDLTTLVGTRIFHLRVPQDTARPYIAFARIGLTPLLSINAPIGTVNSRIAFDVWGDTAEQAEDVAIALRHGLDGWRGDAAGLAIHGATRIDEREEFDDDLQGFHIRQEYTVLHTED